MSVTQGDPMWCKHYARRTPMIPVHNGTDKCLGCGVDVRALRETLRRQERKS